MNSIDPNLQDNRQGLVALPNSSRVLTLGIVSLAFSFGSALCLYISYCFAASIVFFYFAILFWGIMFLFLALSFISGIIALGLAYEPAMLVRGNRGVYTGVTFANLTAGWICALLGIVVSVVVGIIIFRVIDRIESVFTTLNLNEGL